MECYAVYEDLEVNTRQNAATDVDNQSTGTRSFSSSNQFVTMMILRLRFNNSALDWNLKLEQYRNDDSRSLLLTAGGQAAAEFFGPI